jgi:hypothetical protein
MLKSREPNARPGSDAVHGLQGFKLIAWNVLLAQKWPITPFSTQVSARSLYFRTYSILPPCSEVLREILGKISRYFGVAKCSNLRLKISDSKATVADKG